MSEYDESGIGIWQLHSDNENNKFLFAIDWIVIR